MRWYTKMEKTIIKFEDIEIKKEKFHQHKRPISIKKNIHINKIVLSNKVSFGQKGFKCFIGFKNSTKIKPLCIFLPKMSAYRKDCDETKYVSFLIKDDKPLEKYNALWEKINSLKKEFDSEPVYNEKYLKAKIKSYDWKLNTNFRDNKIPKEGSQFISVLLIDSVFRTGKNY